MQWYKTKLPGIRYRLHPTRKHGIQADRYYVVTYKDQGKTRTEALGWMSEGMNEVKALEVLATLRANRRDGEGFQTLSEKKRIAKETRDAEIAEKRRIEAERLAAEKAEAERLRLEHDSVFSNVFEKYAASNQHKISLRVEQNYCRNWILPVIGAKQLENISAFDLERIRRNMLKENRSLRTIQYILAIIRQVFNYAQQRSLFFGTPPTKAVRQQKFDNMRIRFLSVEEAQALMVELKGRSTQTWQMSEISLQCGLRFSEIASLRWQHIDMNNKTLFLVDTKNSKSRVVFMTSNIHSIFESIPEGKKNDLVFPDQNGAVMKRISPAFFRAVDQLGLNAGVDDRRLKVCFHTLRHSFASRLIASGADMPSVRDLLGHKDFTMLSRYSHSGENARREAIMNMERMNSQNSAEIIPMPIINKKVKP